MQIFLNEIQDIREGKRKKLLFIFEKNNIFFSLEEAILIEIIYFFN